METIMLGEVLRTLDSGATCSLGFRTFDFKKDRGGEYVDVQECHKHNYKTLGEKKQERNDVRFHRNPNHYENSTRNIVVMPGGEIRKLHIRLIRKFNGKTVL